MTQKPVTHIGWNVYVINETVVTIRLFQTSAEEEHYHVPAADVVVNGIEAITRLRDVCDNIINQAKG